MNIQKHKPIIIAVDGFSSCGKSTLAKQLAALFDLVYIDTGAMYRAVTLFFIEQKVDLTNEQQIAEGLDQIHIVFENHNGANTTFLNGRNVEEAIRSMDVSMKVSQVAAITAVRKRMVALQQSMGKPEADANEKFNGLVMDGRDIGTVVFPFADIKFFITADPAVRAQRRYQEIRSKGGTTSFEEVLNNVNLRDGIDTSREDSPLKMAEDAILIDNTNLTIREQLDEATRIIEKYISDHRE